MPNDRALEPQSREAYGRYKLNARQTELIVAAQPKRDYYLQSPRGNRRPRMTEEVGMPDLKLSNLPDRTPVKITITVPPELNAALQAYAELYREAHGEAEPVTLIFEKRDGAWLIVHEHSSYALPIPDEETTKQFLGS